MRRRDEPEAAKGRALPTGIAHLAAEGEGVLEALLRPIQVSAKKVELGAEGLREGNERGHASCLGFLQGPVEHDVGLVELSAEKVETSEEG